MKGQVIEDFILTPQQLCALDDAGLIAQAQAANEEGKPGMILLQPMVPLRSQVIGCFLDHDKAKKLIEILKGDGPLW